MGWITQQTLAFSIADRLFPISEISAFRAAVAAFFASAWSLLLLADGVTVFYTA
jgi:hypothetical protein